MRISTQVFYQRSNERMFTQQSKVSQLNTHLSAEKRVIYGSDDAVAISTIQSLKQAVSLGEQYQKNGEMAGTASELEGKSLEQVTNIMQSVREQLVKTGNGTLNDQGREALALELEGLRDELMGVANTKDGNSQYIFSGFEVDTQPFQQNEFGAVDYHGDDGQRYYRVGSGVDVVGNDSGSSIFMDIPEGNGSFVSEGGDDNTGSGVISAASVIDSKQTELFSGTDYTISISEPTLGNPEYSVYGLKENAVTGNADVKISQVDLNDPNISLVDPVLYDASVVGSNSVNLEFVSTATPGQFEVQINGQSSLPAFYDTSDTNAQTITIDGVSIEVNGIPNAGDQYDFTKYVEPTPYKEDQSIEFNGIKTQLKGNVKGLDSFTLSESGTKDIFSTIQDAIDAIRIPGTGEAEVAQRIMRLDMARNQVDNAMQNVSTAVSSVGSRTKTIENQNEVTQDFNLISKTTLSNLEDLDAMAAASDLTQQQDLLEITQKTFVKMQSLSLFEIL